MMASSLNDSSLPQSQGTLVAYTTMGTKYHEITSGTYHGLWNSTIITKCGMTSRVYYLYSRVIEDAHRWMKPCRRCFPDWRRLDET
jgi:hypothetical protein